MKKILLASVAIMGAAGLGQAQAQVEVLGHPNQGRVIAPSTGGNSGANTNINTQVNPDTYVGNSWQKTTAPKPGTIVIRLNGRVQFQVNAFWSTGNSSSAIPAVAPSVVAHAQPIAGAPNGPFFASLSGSSPLPQSRTASWNSCAAPPPS